MSSSSLFSSNLCFNSECNRVKPERSRKGWRLRNGMHAQLCHPCGNAFEEGKFCEIFHSNSSGWRCCESCGMRIHCGCVVSSYCFVLLDVGGIECMNCAKKNLILTTNMLWPAPPCPPTLPEKIVKKLSQKVRSDPWKKITNLFDTSTEASCEVHVTTKEIDEFGERESVLQSSLEKNKNKDLFDKSNSDGSKFTTLKVPGSENLGTNCEERPITSEVFQVPSATNVGTSTHVECLTVHITGTSLEQGQSKGTESCEEKPLLGSLPPPVKSYSDQQNDIKITSGNKTPAQSHYIQQNGSKLSNGNQTRFGKPKGDARGRSQLLPRYWPRLTNHELKKMSGDSNSLITPLFEKMLSASDAGRIGRLVLPKKCAEAYFPPIAQPEGLPLKVQDAKGKEWVFQFRFWPNNNSRMYVLEGVTPCIQSMQLQAGDTVTFSRLDPEGKLIMGFRKTSTDQETLEDEGGHGIPVFRDVSVNVSNSTSTWSQTDKSGYIAKDMVGSKSCPQKKRRYSSLFPKNKRLKIESRDMIALKITWEEAQDLIRPPSTSISNVVIIEGYEFEEFEKEPVIGRPTIFSKDDTGADIQWAQCEDCFKWRKIPIDALLPSKWTCSDNQWDLERSSCSKAEEMKEDQLEELLPKLNNVTTHKTTVKDEYPVETAEGLDGLDALANLAVMGEEEQQGQQQEEQEAQTTTRHPRHRPGCSCIVCIQPPSGKGPKHHQSCTCSVCITVRRRFQTLMLRREKKLSERGEAAAAAGRGRPKPPPPPPGDCLYDSAQNSSNSSSSSSSRSEGVKRRRGRDGRGKGKGKFDLNIKPEREEESSPWGVVNLGNSPTLITFT